MTERADSLAGRLIGAEQMAAVRDHSRAVARIARWEITHSVGRLDRRSAFLVAAALLLALGAAGAAVASGGVALDADIYRVAVDEESPYHDVVDDASSLTPVRPEGDADVRVVDENTSDRTARFVASDEPKSQAALASLRTAVRDHNTRLMAAEENRSAAFPVSVTLQYESRTRVTADTGDDGGGGTGGGGTDGGGGGDASTSGDDGGDDDDGLLSVPDIGGGPLLGSDRSGSPADIQPPFPFESLVLAFAFLVPLNFVIQAYGSTVLNERINRRGELLLVAPVTPGDIVAGKTLPYLGAAIGVTAVIAVAVGGGALSVLAVAPLALLFLAATFVGGMFARSFKELTFVTVAVSTFLTTYAFVPAIFTDVTPVALISPLTLVVRDLQGVGATPVEYAFSTGPVYLSAAVLFLLGLGVYREEDMFTQRSVPLKVLDALDARLRGPRSVAVLSALFIPFVFVAELLTVALLFALPVDVSLPLLLVAIAGVEEVAKSGHVYAGFVKARFERTGRTALTLGALSGLGFFLGEKVTAVVQVVGLPELRLGRAAFQPAGVAGDGAGLLVLLLAPLVLHVGTAAISAVGASRGKRGYLVGLGVAVAVHAVYNLGVVVTLG